MASNHHFFKEDESAFSFEQADVKYGEDVSEQEMFENYGSEKGPALFEDFRSYLAREGGIDYNWISDLLLDSSAPASDEDFVAYFARSSGIIDTHTISELRRMLKSETDIPCSNSDPPSYTVELPQEEEEEETLIPEKCDEDKDMSPFLQYRNYALLNSDVDQPTLGLLQQPDPHSLDEKRPREWQGLIGYMMD